MTTPDNRSEYERRMHAVLAYVDQHLDQPLDLERLAAVAHFSPFHFHRLFSAWMGETLGDYLRRRRVEVAAMRLAAQPGVRVLEVALAVGFGSGEAFTRAFRARFGSSPTAWRQQQAQNRNPGQVKRKPDQAVGAALFEYEAPHHTAEHIMNVTLIERPATRLAYIRHLGPYGEAVSRFWQEQAYPWLAQNNLLGQARYGISHDDPGVTAAEQCRYDAGVEVGADFVARGKTQLATLPGGTYAALKFRGKVAEIGAAWASLLRDWLPASGLQLDARPCFEYYPTDACYDPATGVFECEICIPVMPL